MILFTEIGRVRSSLFQVDGVKKEPLALPDAEGDMVTLTEKVYVPVKDHPEVSLSNMIIFKYFTYYLFFKHILRYSAC